MEKLCDAVKRHKLKVIELSIVSTQWMVFHMVPTSTSEHSD